MFVPIKVTVNDSVEYDRGFNAIGDKLLAFGKSAGDMTEPLTEIGETLMANVAATMGAQGAGAWAPLSTPYGPWKESKVGGVPMLVGIRPLHKGSREHPTRPESYGVSGSMLRSLLDAGTALHVSPKRMVYSPTSEIAGYHEDGTEKMPARPPVALTPAVLHSWDRSFVTWLAGLVEKVNA